MLLSIIVPVFNEKDTFDIIYKRIQEESTPKEIIIVDDGSTDGTLELLDKIKDDNVKVIKHDRNYGKGAAIKTGIEEVSGDYTLIQDADTEYDPCDYVKLLDPVIKGKAVVVYGSRFTGERRNMLFFHMLGNKFLSLVTNILYNTTISDMETCYKLIKTDILKSVNIRSKKFDFEPEITAKILKKGIRIYEVPISYAGREFDEGKKITWRDGFAALFALLRYRFTN